MPLPETKIKYRERISKGDINPVFRFKPKTDSERVIDYIRNGGFTQLQSSKTVDELEYTLYNILIVD